MGDARRGDGFDEAQSDVVGQLLEVGTAGTEQDRHLVEDQLVDQIQTDLGISRKVLTERLNHLVDHGVLEHRPYDRRPRYEYHLTAKGTELVDLLIVMTGWGDKWLAGEAGPPVLYRHHACGEISGVDLRCAHCGEPMHAGDIEPLEGPGAAA